MAKDGAVNRIHPAIEIANGANVTISGNLYADGTAYDANKVTNAAGTEYWVNKSPMVVVNKNQSIRINESATLRLNSKIVNCNNDIEVGDNSGLIIRNRNGEEKTDTTDTMQLFADNIITKAGTSNATIDIVGNTMLRMTCSLMETNLMLR